MIFKPHPIFTDYEVSDDGQVRGPRGLLKPTHRPNGYRMVCVYKDGESKTRYVHRLVLETFVGIQDGVCMHLDNDRSNNALTNLRWGTHAENIQQAKDEDRFPQAFTSKLTSAQIEYIRKSKLEFKILAKIFGVHRNTIARHRRGIKKRIKRKDPR